MAADNVTEMSFFSKVDHLYNCGWDAMVLGSETSTFFENQTKSNSYDSGNLVGKITSVGDIFESGCHSDYLEDHCQNPPNAKRKRNVSSCKNGEVDRKQRAEEDFVHIRAKKGKATSNHSLAERARRERISERMRLLQELVPGCDKITGKAVVLDEIINYVQSLQHQVEEIWNNELQSIIQSRFCSSPFSMGSLLENGLTEMEL